MPPKSKIFVCDQHASNISKKLQTFYRDQLFFDIALVTKANSIKVHAHRTVLSASSDYFLAMLCSTLKEARSDVIELGIDGATLKLVVDFMYSGTIELHCENVARILTAADVLKMTTLKVACSDFIGETIDVANWLSIASMAKEQQSAELHKKALEFALQHFEEVCKKDEFLQLTEEQLSELISSDDLYVNSEETVFHSVVSWVKYDKGHREKLMIDLLSHVRFSFLTPNFIITNRHSISKTYECLELLFSWLEAHLSRTKLTKRHSQRKKANITERETLGFVSGATTDNLKFQTFDPELNIWSCEDLPPPPTKRVNYRAMAMDKKLFVTGGSVSDCSTNVVEYLDLQTKEWTKLPPMSQTRQLPAMAELNGDLYVVGGKSNGKRLCSVERYDFQTCEWQDLAPMHSGSNRVTVLGESIYAVGNGTTPIECFNPSENKWTQLPHKTERSIYFGIAGVGGHLYAVGGNFNGQKSTTLERFDPSTNTWTVINPGLGLALSSMRCVSWNDRLIACRGLDNQNKVHNSVVEYNPEEDEWKTLASLARHNIVQSSTSLFTFTK